MILKKNIALFTVTLFSLGMVQLVAMDKDTIAEGVRLAATTVTGSNMIGHMAEGAANDIIKLLNEPKIGEKIEAGVNDVVKFGQKKAEVVKQDFDNIAADIAYSVHTMKSPGISKHCAVLNMQKQYKQAAIFKQKATTPYYGYGVASAIVGTTLLTTAPFSKVGMDSLKLGGLGLAVSLGCYYKTRYDLSKLRLEVEQECAASTLQRLFKKDKSKFHDFLAANLKATANAEIVKKSSEKSAFLNRIF